MKNQMAGVLLKTEDAILGESLAVLLKNQAPVFSEKVLFVEWLAAKEYACEVRQVLLDANQKKRPICACSSRTWSCRTVS